MNMAHRCFQPSFSIERKANLVSMNKLLHFIDLGSKRSYIRNNAIREIVKLFFRTRVL